MADQAGRASSAVSALGTAGASTDVTPTLDAAGRVILIGLDDRLDGIGD